MKQKGITLIALVITIVVLMILAGITIGTLRGENGIIGQAKDAKDQTKIGEEKEQVDVSVVTAIKKDKWGNITEDNLAEERTKNIGERDVDYTLTTAGDKFIVIYTDTGNRYIVDKTGSIKQILPIEKGKTIGEIYEAGKIVIGDTINYTSDTTIPEGTEWIILGKDKDGSIMLTTSKPIEDGFTANATAEAWLTYEDDLNTACEIYGGTVQYQQVTARSMTLEDVNRVIGFVEPSFNTYTFGSELDFENKKVDCWHPDTNGTATEGDGTGNPNFWSKNETTYECDAYYYYIDTSDNNKVKYHYEGTNWKNTEYTTTTLKNTNLILGEDLSYFYLLASRSVMVKYSSNVSAAFFVSGVYDGSVDSYYWDWGRSTLQGNFWDDGIPYMVPVRPIINLPSNIKVEEVSGEWRIID